MNNNKFAIRLMALLCLSLSESLGAESPEFLSASASQQSLQTPLPTAKELDEIDKKLIVYKRELKDLKSDWQFYDDTWETLGKLQNGENDKIFEPTYIQKLYNAHAKIIREITDLNKEIGELEQKKASLEKIKTALNIDADSLMNVPST